MNNPSGFDWEACPRCGYPLVIMSPIRECSSLKCDYKAPKYLKLKPDSFKGEFNITLDLTDCRRASKTQRKKEKRQMKQIMKLLPHE